MAKTIKAIKCPQCGSVGYTEIQPDRYRCNNCNTVYILDNDDIHIIHHHQAPPATQKATPRAVRIVALLIVAVSAIVILSSVLSQPARKVVKPPRPALYSAPKETLTYRWRSENHALFFDKQQYPHALSVGRIDSNDKSIDRKARYVSVSDPLSGRNTAPHLMDEGQNGSVDFRLWDNGDLMMIVGERQLYRMDKEMKSFVPVDTSFFDRYPEFTAGLAKTEFVSDGLGSGLLLFTNEGKSFYFYPLIEKVYKKQEFHKAYSGMNSVPKNTPLQTAFAFSRQSSDYEDEPIQLIRYQHKNPDGYPRQRTGFSWSKDYVHYGLISENTPYKKVLINKWNQNAQRIASFKDFTPGRRYFSPQVLNYDAQRVLIAFRAAPTRETPLTFQLLNATTSDILWSYNSELKSNTRVRSLMGKDVYLFQNNDGTLALDGSGKKIHYLDANKGYENGLDEFFQKTAGNGR